MSPKLTQLLTIVFLAGCAAKPLLFPVDKVSF